jgi:hypothetical protein
MKKAFVRIAISILLCSSISACRSTATVFPTSTSPAPAQTETVPPTAVPTPTPAAPATGTPLAHPGWTTYPDIRSIKDMVFDPEGNLWAAGPDGLVEIRSEGAQRRFTMKDGLPSDDLLSVGLDTDGAVWVGSMDSGAARFDGKDWQTFTTADGLGGNQVLSIVRYAGYEGVLIGTQNGLSVYNGGFANFSGPSYLPDDGVRDIAAFSGGSIWVGTRKGAILFGPSQTFTTADGLVSDVVNAIAGSPDCSLWIGTSGGVSHYVDGSWHSYTREDGLAGDFVSAAAAALDGSMWFGTGAGLSRFDGQTWTTFTTQDGLVDNEVLSIAVAPDDTLWLGTPGGLSHYAPSLALRSGGTGQIPKFDADLQVAYLKDGNLWLWQAGMSRPLTQNGRVVRLKLSSDGRKAAFTRLNGDLENELWVIDLDGGRARRLVGPDDLAALDDLPQDETVSQSDLKVVIFHFAWVPGQNTLAYDTRRHMEEAGSLYYNDLCLVDAETGVFTTLLPRGQGGRFIYSPDGSQVAIVTPSQISIMEADGSHLRPNLLEYPSIVSYSEAPYYPAPVWSVDSQVLLLALPPRDSLAAQPEPTTLWRIPADGSPATRLGEVLPTDFVAFSVTFSPDLTRLAYLVIAGEPAENRVELHMANSDGSEDITVQEGLNLRFLGWSPDGGHYIYSAGNPQTWYLGGIGAASTQLAIHPENLAWIDGESFLHVENLGCALELRLTSLDAESLVIGRMWNPPLNFDFSF